jgi:hypothetical protein
MNLTLPQMSLTLYSNALIPLPDSPDSRPLYRWLVRWWATLLPLKMDAISQITRRVR